jgi:hypothetical protein
MAGAVRSQQQQYFEGNLEVLKTVSSKFVKK